METIPFGPILANAASILAILAAVIAAIRYLIRAEMEALKEWMDTRFVRKAECRLQAAELDRRVGRLEAAGAPHGPRGRA